MKIFYANPLITILLISDLFVVVGFGFVEPILALFIVDLPGATIKTIGVAMGIYLITKSLTQVPFSRFIDKYDDSFDVKWLFFGTTLIAMTPIIYMNADNVFMIYIAQIINGLGAGFAYPAWLGLWSTHLDRGKESFQWSFYSTITGISTAVAAPTGAYIADTFGFQNLFLAMFIFAIFGSTLTLVAHSYISRSHQHKRR